jgi:hydrogenase nickel incorporation protein HypA/HybF
MHELSIAKSIIDILEQEKRKHGFQSVISIDITLGPLSNVVPESLEFCFEAIKTDTIASDAKLSIRPVPMSAQCRACGKQSQFDTWETVCPDCGSVEMNIVSGSDLEIAGIEVED